MYGGGVSSSRGRTCNLRSDCYSVILWSDIILSGWVVECEYASMRDQSILYGPV